MANKISYKLMADRMLAKSNGDITQVKVRVQLENENGEVLWDATERMELDPPDDSRVDYDDLNEEIVMAWFHEWKKTAEVDHEPRGDEYEKYKLIELERNYAQHLADKKEKAERPEKIETLPKNW